MKNKIIQNGFIIFLFSLLAVFSDTVTLKIFFAFMALMFFVMVFNSMFNFRKETT